ncbi:hypothetical protein JCM33374_g2967 [Metschnikowia sp. JCM 33374]|nr:hypothetical protein JCM33374_g2967 [Metschnikowia sp. JCM 33374]
MKFQILESHMMLLKARVWGRSAEGLSVIVPNLNKSESQIRYAPQKGESPTVLENTSKHEGANHIGNFSGQSPKCLYQATLATAVKEEGSSDTWKYIKHTVANVCDYFIKREPEMEANWRKQPHDSHTVYQPRENIAPLCTPQETLPSPNTERQNQTSNTERGENNLLAESATGHHSTRESPESSPKAPLSSHDMQSSVFLKTSSSLSDITVGATSLDGQAMDSVHSSEKPIDTNWSIQIGHNTGSHYTPA